MSIRIVTAIAILLLGTGRAMAQVPDPALAAEQAGRWEDAIRAHREALNHEPGRADLWVRIADIEARRGNLEACIAALEQAAHTHPSDAALYDRLSQAYAQANQPAAALNAIDGALTLQPDNAAYLRAGAILATWHGDYHVASQRYQRLVRLRAADADVMLKLARVSAWSGDTDESVAAYHDYLAEHGGAEDVWLELARTESWRGNYGEALDTLRTYKQRFGNTDAYSRELAAVSARAGRPTRAINLLQPLLAHDPSSYDLNVIRTFALAEQRRPKEAFDALATVRRLQPAAIETRSAERTVRLLLGSSVQPGASFYSDSDDLRIQRFAPWGTVLLASGTHFSAGYDHEILDAPIRSGLARADAQSSRYDYMWASFGQMIGRLTLDGRVGSAKADDHELTPYAIRAELRATDALTVTGEHSSEFVVISPRTVELGLTQQRDRLALEWDPAARYHVSVDGNYQRLSDGNTRWELGVTPRRALARTESLNLDLGVSAYALSASRDLANGYYDPRRYESYTVVLFPYFKISENVGLGFSVAGGVQRDVPSARFGFGGNATAEATIGIYRPWAVKVSASATNNRRADSGAFHGYGGSVVLIRRF